MGVTGPGLTDAVVATIRFASGALATIEINWIMSSVVGTEDGLPARGVRHRGVSFR